MDCVYICREGDNEELRYSIRSVVKNLPHDNIWVVGGKPEWYSGNHIQVDQSGYKYKNARNNLKAIVESEEISDTFILMNDDFYVIDKVKKMQVMHGETLDHKITTYQDISASKAYIKMLEKTRDVLQNKFNIESPIDYDIHVPMIMRKDGLAEVLESPGLWRSLYGNIYQQHGTSMRDVKVYVRGPMKYLSYDLRELQYPFLSSNDDSFNLVLNNVLMSRFDQPSKYEL